MNMTPDTSEELQPMEYAEPEKNALAKEWNKRITAAKKHWEKYHKRVKHNRKLVAGFDWDKEPDSDKFYTHRANLIHGTITAMLPSIYARNPEMSCTPLHQGRDLKLLCKTIETVVNRQMTEARLKKRGKATVRAALTCSMGIIKATYQRDRAEDPIIKSRIQDTQDNIARIEALILQADDNTRGDNEAVKLELQETLSALQEKVEVVAAEGLTMDRVMSDQLLIDPAIVEFWDYEDADYMIQLIPTKKSTAEGEYKIRLDKAKSYSDSTSEDKNSSGKVFSGSDKADDGDSMICICEVWDKRSHRVYTLAEGCDFFLREPYSPPRVGERWYPFFILPFQTVDGQFIGPSLVDLTEKLQGEHNAMREKKNKHRDAIKPGYLADKSDMNPKDLEAFTESVMNEVTLIDAGGKPVSSVIVPKVHAPIDPMMYDTTEVRYDWEQVSGMQDAARSSVVQPKTATEASIMQQSLSGRVSEFRDQVEDFLQEIAIYAAHILLQELTEEHIKKIMGEHKTGPLTGPDGQPVLDPYTGQPVMGVIEPAYDWPQMSRDEIFDLVQLRIRAGSTGEPDKLDAQETWLKMLPAIQPMIQMIMQIQAGGGDAGPLVALLKETITRFDDKLDLEQFVPKAPPPPPPMPMGMPGMPPGMPPQGMPPPMPQGMPPDMGMMQQAA